MFLGLMYIFNVCILSSMMYTLLQHSAYHMQPNINTAYNQVQSKNQLGNPTNEEEKMAAPSNIRFFKKYTKYSA